MKLFIIILFLFSTPVKAGFHIGASRFVLGHSNSEISYNVGYSKLFEDCGITKDCVVDFTINIPTVSEFNKRGFAVESTSTYGTVLFGKKIDNYIISGFLALVKVENKIYYNNTIVDKSDHKAAVFGGYFTYFFTKNIAGAVSVLLPNTNIDLKLSSLLGVNYYF